MMMMVMNNCERRLLYRGCPICSAPFISGHSDDTIMMMIVMTVMINNVARYMQYTKVESVNH